MKKAESKKRAPAQAKGGASGAPLAWRQLCDPFFADHACEALQAEIEYVAAGHASALHTTLRTDLVGPLEAYLAAHWPATGAASRTDLRVARAMLDCADDLTGKFEEVYPFGPGTAPLYAAALRDAWRRFIEAVGGPAVLNVSIVQSKRASKGRTPKQSKLTGEELTGERLRQIIDDGLRYGRFVNKKDAERQVEQEFGVSRSTQHRLLRCP